AIPPARCSRPSSRSARTSSPPVRKERPVARNPLLGLALLGALTLAGCSGSGQQDEAKAAQAQLATLRARTDSLRQHAQAVRHDTAAALAATTTLGTPPRDRTRAP